MALKNSLVRLADRAGVYSVYGFLRRALTRSQVAILTYHRVSPVDPFHSVQLIDPALFKRQIEFLCRSFEIVPLERLVQCIREKKDLPRRAVAITFDDGYADNYYYAFPLLERERLPATIFLATGYTGSDRPFPWDLAAWCLRHIESRQIELEGAGLFSLCSEQDRALTQRRILAALKTLPGEKKDRLLNSLLRLAGQKFPPSLARELVMSWEQAKEMSGRGISFGAHSVNHPVLTQIRAQQAEWEIRRSGMDIESRLPQKCRLFAYPYGIYADRHVKMVASAGFTGAAGFLSPRLVVAPGDPLRLSRINVMTDFSSFKARLCGLAGDLSGL